MNYKGFMGNKLLSGLLLIIVCLPLISWSQVQKRNYAVIGLKNAEGVSAGEAEIIADRLRIELFNTGGASMMERDQMQEILSEQGFQQTGACTDEACMIEIGQLLGVERLISGSIGKLGSMFLLNFRAIDVQTAKIIAVVSKDISGGIEDVVKLLPSVARELVAAAAPKKPVDAPANEVIEPEKKEPEVVEAKPEVKEPEKKEPVPEVAEVESGKRSKNKNRGGIKICLALIPKTVKHDVFVKRDTITNLPWDELFDNAEYRVFLNPQIKAIIKAGRFISINVGGGYTRGWSRFYTEDTYLYETHNHEVIFTYHIPSLLTGVNFVLRFFPVKINVGFMLDANIPIVICDGKNLDVADSCDYSDFYDMEGKDVYAQFKLSAGGRVGVEIMPGTPHIGIGFDFLIRPFTFYYTRESVFFDEIEIEDKVKLSAIGFNIGLSFYK